MADRLLFRFPGLESNDASDIKNYAGIVIYFADTVITIKHDCCLTA